MSGKYYVYKFSKGDEVLYIGRTNNLKYRFEQHEKSSLFFLDSDKREYMVFENRIDHVIAEMYLINKYKPRDNKEFNYDDSPTSLCIELPPFKKLNEESIKSETGLDLNAIKRQEQALEEHRLFIPAGFKEIPVKHRREYHNGKVEIQTLGSSVKRYMIYVDLADEDVNEDEFYEEAPTPKKALEVINSNGLKKYFEEVQ